MTKVIGIKELQKNTKEIRAEVAKGVSFIVVYRSKPIFEIKPLSSSDVSFEGLTNSFTEAGIYNKEFLKRMQEAENDLRTGKVTTYQSTEEFLKSLS